MFSPVLVITGVCFPNLSLSTALNSNIHIYSSFTFSVADFSNVTVNVPFNVSFANTLVVLFSSSFFILVYFASVLSFTLQFTPTSAS